MVACHNGSIATRAKSLGTHPAYANKARTAFFLRFLAMQVHLTDCACKALHLLALDRLLSDPAGQLPLELLSLYSTPT
jgi:hypothetical protein